MKSSLRATFSSVLTPHHVQSHNQGYLRGPPQGHNVYGLPNLERELLHGVKTRSGIYKQGSGRVPPHADEVSAVRGYTFPSDPFTMYGSLLNCLWCLYTILLIERTSVCSFCLYSARVEPTRDRIDDQVNGSTSQCFVTSNAVRVPQTKSRKAFCERVYLRHCLGRMVHRRSKLSQISKQEKR